VPPIGQDRRRDHRNAVVNRTRTPAAELAANIAAAQRAADRSRTGGVWSLGHLKICWLALATAGVLLVVAGAVFGGGRAAAGAALGIVIVGAFFSVSAVVIAKAGQISPKLVMVAALATYVVKIVALGVVLTFLPRNWIFDTHWMAAGVGLGLFVWLGAHMRYVWTTQIYYVDPH
jgi:ATP synthase protein I